MIVGEALAIIGIIVALVAVFIVIDYLKDH